jgi:hypothetical protein
MMAEMLMAYGKKVLVPLGDSQVAIVRTGHVDAVDELDDRFQQALRVSECLYSYTNEMVAAGEVHVIRNTEPLSDCDAVRAFALELGTLDLNTVDQREVMPSDYEWHSLAVAVIRIGHEDLIKPEHVTLVDAEDGVELTDSRALELHALLGSLSAELRAFNFGDATTLDEISTPELELNAKGQLAPAFNAIDFIVGVDCDECSSNHSVCAHNGSAN